MDQQFRVPIEDILAHALQDSVKKLVDKVDDSGWWACVLILSFPFHLLAQLLYFILHPILVGVRLAVTHADRVVFVLASSFLSFYQVPRKVFFIYMAVLAVTGFLQFLRYDSSVRHRFLFYLSCISCGTSNVFLRRFTTLHWSNPFNRCLTRSEVIYVPIGLEIHPNSRIEVFDFPVLNNSNFDRTAGNCRIKIDTLDNITGSNTIRDLSVESPWGRNRFTVDMENDNLGRLISYFNRVIETDCKELICILVNGRFEALSILGVVKHFNSGLPIVKLELCSPARHFIY